MGQVAVAAAEDWDTAGTVNSMEAAVQVEPLSLGLKLAGHLCRKN